jgi:flavodoxin II
VYEASKALTPDGTQFVGLALDEENEFSKTAERVAVWCAQIRGEFGV